MPDTKEPLLPKVAFISMIFFVGLALFKGIVARWFPVNIPSTTVFFRLMLVIAGITMLVSIFTGDKKLSKGDFIAYAIALLIIILGIVFFPQIIPVELPAIPQAVQSVLGVP